MMRPAARGVRARLALALTAFSAVAALLVAAAFWLGEEYLEEESLRRLHQSNAPGQGAEGARQLLGYMVELERQRGVWLLGLLLASAAGAALIAWWASGHIVRRSLMPLADLVDQIEGIDLERRNHRLHLDSADPELQVIVAALNAHMAQLDALVERERAFAAAASHELRTPLTVIGGAAELLAQGGQAPASVLARIARAVAHARQDLEALLALSRGTAAPRLSQRLDLLLPDIASLHIEAHGNPATRVEWQVTGPVERSIATGPLSIVFGNLLRNALRAAAGKRVLIAVDAQGFRISDEGPGWPPEMLGGTPLTSQSRRDGGSGLGLHIALALAQREGWTLQLRPAEGGGACAELKF
ncbi:MAG TPA: HAMP domain-containing sensor histidine kinase [Verrucomicrobiae bacterium]|nr:HAMP domain-containing sensor histidine kinase [Verrucomicrobiae bacterium]